MTIPKYCVIKHEKYRDVAFRVTKCFDTGTKLKLKGWWINQGKEKSWPIVDTTIEIDKDRERHGWLIANDPEALCLRDTDWRKLVIS